MKNLFIITVVSLLFVGCNAQTPQVEEEVTQTENATPVAEKETVEELTFVEDDGSYKIYEGEMTLSGTFEVREQFFSEDGSTMNCLVFDSASSKLAFDQTYSCFDEDSIEISAENGEKMTVKIDRFEHMYRETTGHSWMTVVEVL